MPHRAQQIMEAMETVVDTVSGLTVERSKYNAAESDQLPHCEIEQGDDIQQSESSNLFVDSELSVELYIKVEANDYQAALANQRSLINQAVMSDYTLGLGFVIDTQESAADKPELIEGDKPRAMQRILYTVNYRRTRANPE